MAHPELMKVRSVEGSNAAQAAATGSQALSQRQHIENEIVSTEESFVESLRYLGNEYEQPLRRQLKTSSGPSIFSREELDVIFADTAIIRNFNESLLSDFHHSQHPVDGEEEAEEEVPPATASTAISSRTRTTDPTRAYMYSPSLPSIIKTRAPFMKIYTAYVRSHSYCAYYCMRP